MSLEVYRITVRANNSRRLSTETDALVRRLLSELVPVLGRPADDGPHVTLTGSWHVDNVAHALNTGEYVLHGWFAVKDAERVVRLASSIVSTVLAPATTSARKRRIPTSEVTR